MMQLSNQKYFCVDHVKKAAINDTPGFKVTPVDRSFNKIMGCRRFDQLPHLNESMLPSYSWMVRFSFHFRYRLTWPHLISKY